MGITLYAVKNAWKNFKAGKIAPGIAKKLPVEWKPRDETLGERLYEGIGSHVYDMENKGERITSTTVRNMFEKYFPQLKDLDKSTICRIMEKLGYCSLFALCIWFAHNLF